MRIFLAAKIYTMYYETDEYKDGAITRYNNRLDFAIYDAANELEHARTSSDQMRQKPNWNVQSSIENVTALMKTNLETTTAK